MVSNSAVVNYSFFSFFGENVFAQIGRSLRPTVYLIDNHESVDDRSLENADYGEDGNGDDVRAVSKWV